MGCYKDIQWSWKYFKSIVLGARVAYCKTKIISQYQSFKLVSDDILILGYFQIHESGLHKEIGHIKKGCSWLTKQIQNAESKYTHKILITCKNLVQTNEICS